MKMKHLKILLRSISLKNITISSAYQIVRLSISS
ncbi:unnamed protein product [Musa acuminata subsp. malaccensis]|uniref:(wild Malaysian banana) hypothetical protein n=1 Tax=Musa acuminata subsp. malaccensis TaxID=214687 RepID=A0A804JJ50_MUSAM|nr:unnamed protein product [Musa acuminata subsp. malaccensis]